MLEVHFTMAERFDDFGTTVASFKLDLFAEIVMGSFTDMALGTEVTKTDAVLVAIRNAMPVVDKRLRVGSFRKHGQILISEAVLKLIQWDACFQKVECPLEVLDHS